MVKAAPKHRDGRSAGGAELVFDAKSRHEFVTGFHKRKQERRAVAKQQEIRRATTERRERRRDHRARKVEAASRIHLLDEVVDEGAAGESDGSEPAQRESPSAPASPKEIQAMFTTTSVGGDASDTAEARPEMPFSVRLQLRLVQSRMRMRGKCITCIEMDASS